MSRPASRTKMPSAATRPETEISFNFPFTTTTSLLLRGQEVTSSHGGRSPRMCVFVCVPLLAFPLANLCFLSFGLQRVLTPCVNPQEATGGDHHHPPIGLWLSRQSPPTATSPGLWWLLPVRDPDDTGELRTVSFLWSKNVQTL